MWQFQRTFVWEQSGWKLKHSAVLETDMEPTYQSPADPWSKTWYQSTPPPYVVWERWFYEDTKQIDGSPPRGWILVQSTRNWK